MTLNQTPIPIPTQAPRGVPLSPSSMVDSVADWPLSRVVDFLQKKEKGDEADVDVDCRLFAHSGICMFHAITSELARQYDVSRGKMCRWLSYHGDAIAKNDLQLQKLQTINDSIRRRALSDNAPALTRIQAGALPYSPASLDAERVSLYLYNSWVLSDITTWSELCGVTPIQVAQVYALKSILTTDVAALSGVTERIHQECSLWDRWLRYRANFLEMAVSAWESAGL